MTFSPLRALSRSGKKNVRLVYHDSIILVNDDYIL